jgi:hypothetical protein
MTYSMFEIRETNDANKREAINDLLRYINKPYERSTGLCSFLHYSYAYGTLQEEIKVITKGKRNRNWKDVPVECSICNMLGKPLEDAFRMYAHEDKSDNTSLAVQLRLWWAYNMAVAISKE